MDRLEGRYDNLKAPESPREVHNTGKIGKRGGSPRVGDPCISDLGQWSHFLPSVGGDLPGNYPDLHTQEGIFAGKINSWEEMAAWRIALGFGSQFFRSRANWSLLAQH